MWRAPLRPLPISGAALVAAALLASVQAAAGASLFDPALRFRTVATEHFFIHFHQGEERLAARLAAIAEQTWAGTRLPLGDTPPRRTHVVLADQTESANGWATPLPYNTIVINAAWPPGSEFIGDIDDWLRVVFVHEFTHIVHLDRSVGWARVVRGLFGRTALAFPNLLLPTWQIEGLATYQESASTGAGRLHAGNFRAIEREAGRAGRLEPLDRVNGGLTDWPGGAAPYAYGLGFHAYLADRYGASSLHELARATAGRVPYFSAGAFENVFGAPLGQLWQEYQQSMRRSEPREEDGVAAMRLTRHGFTVVGPRFAPARCAGCPAEIVYSVRSPHDFPALLAIAADGSTPRQLATRYYGSTIGVSAHHLVFDQQERRRNVGLYSDLFVLDRATGDVRALTAEARLLDPDLSPDGRTIVAVREGVGRRELVRLNVDAANAGRPRDGLEVLVAEDDTQFDAPRWSPDGRSIAVERHRRGARSEIVVVEVASRSVRTVAAPAGARVVTPAWRPDSRAIVAAAEVGDDVFNLYEFPLDGAASRKLTYTTGGATWPDVAPDGRTIVFVGYTVDGFDLFTISYPPAEDGSGVRRDTARRDPPGTGTPAEAAIQNAAVPVDATAYAPWATLRPTSWSPIVESLPAQWRVGVTTGGYDVLAYHAYAVAATWLVAGRSDVARPSSWTPDWAVAYAYDRWRPTFFAAASHNTSFFLAAVDDGDPQRAAVREREVEAGVLFPLRRVRVSHRLLASFRRSDDVYTLPGEVRSIERFSARAGAATTTARTYGYSISPEDGVRLGATIERAQEGLASARSASTVTADVRAYLPGWSRHHVVALRAAGGASYGDAAIGRSFNLGGATNGGDVLSFARDAFSLLRGFGANTFAGRRILTVNADYRWPIARPQRGFRTWPVFLHSVHAAAFTDVGHAWNQRFDAADVKTSIGGELSFDVVLGYALPLTITAGAAWGRDGAGRADHPGTAYFRVGHAF